MRTSRSPDSPSLGWPQPPSETAFGAATGIASRRSHRVAVDVTGVVSGREAGGRFAAGLWRLADPKISLASFASLGLGACAAAADGPLHAGWLAITVLGIFALEVAKNASGEVYDFASGADTGVAIEDRSPFSGGKRVIVDALLSVRQTWGIAIVSYALAAAAGVAIVLGREPRVLALALVGGCLAFFYHAPPLRLSYRGFGEAAVALCYGPGIAVGTYAVQRQAFSAETCWAAVPLGLLIACFLWVDEFPDFRADRMAGKRNGVVRLGRRRAAVAYVLWIALAGACIVAVPLLGAAPRTTWMGLAALIPSVLSARWLLAGPERIACIVPAQRRALLAFLVYAIAVGAGLLL